MNSYKIFFDDFQILLISSDIEVSEEKKMILHANVPDDIEPLVYLIKKHFIKSDVIVFCSDLEASFKYLSNNFLYIKAAGGIVKNDKEELLFIYKQKHWDLPKGKIDKGEKKRIAAMREVSEECGVKKLEIIRKVAKTYHIAKLRGRYVLKKTVWYEMFCSDPKNLKPETAEGITDVKWIDPKKESNIKVDLYRSLSVLLKDYYDFSD